MKSRPIAKYLAAAALCAAVVAAFLLSAGRALVVDDAQPSDLAVVLDGGFNDSRLQRGIDLLKSGNTHELVIDASTSLMFGRPVSEYAQDYVRRLPAEQARHVHVCTYMGDSTRLELRGVWNCVQTAAPGAVQMLLVTSDFHSRRALSVARRLCPRYRWSVSAVPDARFRIDWWRERESAKSCLTEWQKLIWWQIFERWRA